MSRQVPAMERLLGYTPTWYADAACLEHPELDFHPGRGEQTEAQINVCRSCLVRPECLREAMEIGRPAQGVRGGTTGRQRTDLRRAFPCPTCSAAEGERCRRIVNRDGTPIPGSVIERMHPARVDLIVQFVLTVSRESVPS